jgi:hypothetical protein
MRKSQSLECEEVCGDEKEEIVHNCTNKFDEYSIILIIKIVQGSVKALLHALVYISYIYTCDAAKET